MANRQEEIGKSDRFYFLGLQSHVTEAMKLKDKPRQHIKKQKHHYANKGPYSQSYGFSCSYV